MTGLIGVTGVTGNIGGRVAALLAETGADLRLIARDPTRAPSLGADVRQASYDDPEALRTAMDGVSTLFFVSAAEAIDRVAQHANVVQAAVDAHVERIVYLSFLGASPTAVFTLATQHWATEQDIRDSGLGFTFLRDSMYADYMPLMVGPDGVIRGPAGNGRASLVAHEDIARSATAVLLEGDAHVGMTYELTGPEAISLTEVAERLSRLVEREITFYDETHEEALESRAQYGAADWEVAGWISSYEAVAAGELATVSTDVLLLTGRRPVSLERCLLNRPELLDKLRS